MNVDFHPAALREVEDAQTWYEERSLLAATAFLHELSIAVQRIRQAPNRYPSAEGRTAPLSANRPGLASAAARTARTERSERFEESERFERRATPSPLRTLRSCP